MTALLKTESSECNLKRINRKFCVPIDIVNCEVLIPTVQAAEMLLQFLLFRCLRIFSCDLSLVFILILRSCPKLLF